MDQMLNECSTNERNESNEKKKECGEKRREERREELWTGRGTGDTGTLGGVDVIRDVA